MVGAVVTHVRRRVHVLRHDFASLLARLGVPLCVGASRFDLKMGILRAASLGWCNGSTLQAKRSGRWDSNPRPTTWKAAALDQTELLPPRIGAAARTCDCGGRLSIQYRTSRLPRGFGDRMHARPCGLRARAFVPGSRWWSGSLASSRQQGSGRLTVTTGGPKTKRWK